MRQIERHRHQVLCLVAGIAEHHALVAGTLFVLIAIVHTTVDIVALLMDGGQYAARVAVELVLGLGVPYALDGVAGYGLQVDILAAAHFAHDDYLTRGDKRLAGHTGLLVVSQKLVEYRVTYLVGHFVGMALGN